jgi:hypothetical protein
VSSDIYDMKQAPDENGRKNSAVSQRRNEYLRATGGEVVPHRRHHHHHSQNSQSSGWIAALFGLGVLALLVAGAVWWLVSKR